MVNCNTRKKDETEFIFTNTRQGSYLHRFGILYRTYSLIRAFLSGRTIRRERSATGHSHLLNFINDFLEQLQSKVHIVSDLIVFKVINNMTDLEILQPDLQGLDNQEITCIIEIHPAKMQCDASGKQTLFDIIHAERVSVMGRDRLKILECKYLQ